MEDSSCLCCPGPRGMSKNPGPCSRKWADWCLAYPVLSIRGVGGGVGWCLPLLLFRFESGAASLELSVGDVDAQSIHSLLFDLGLVLWTSCSLSSSLVLSVRDVVRAAEVGVRRAPGLGARVVRSRERGSSPLVIALVLSPELSVGTQGRRREGTYC